MKREKFVGGLCVLVIGLIFLGIGFHTQYLESLYGQGGGSVFLILFAFIMIVVGVPITLMGAFGREAAKTP
jgi:SNF family Na+-dependent transporter